MAIMQNDVASFKKKKKKLSFYPCSYGNYGKNKTCSKIKKRQIFMKIKQFVAKIICFSPCMVLIFSESYSATVKTINLSKNVQNMFNSY